MLKYIHLSLAFALRSAALSNTSEEDEAFVSDPPTPPIPRGVCTMCFF